MSIDVHSETWATVSRFLAERRERCLENILKDSANVDRIRGEVAVIDGLLRLATDKPPPIVQTTTYL